MYFSNIKIKNNIKEGGQKNVFLAEHPEYGLIVYKDCKINSEVDSSRINREIAFLQSIDEKSFPKVFDFHIDKQNNQLEIIEEYIDGGSLSSKLESKWNEDAAISFLKLLLVPVMILWEKRIIHRDIKPDNIMFRNDGSLVLIDLGIARFLDELSLTRTMNIFGPCTPIYAAPEQLTNQKRAIDFRTDQYSIGITLLQLVLGFHPFDPSKLPNCKTNIIQNLLTGIYYSPSLNCEFSEMFCILINKLLKIRQYQRFCTPQDLLSYVNTNWRVI